MLKMASDLRAGRRPVSVIMTVYNEAATIEQVLNSLLDQSLPPAEVVIVDGGSTDRTLELVAGFGRLAGSKGAVKIRCISRPGANISVGRNAAIAAASNELIAVTDAGTRLPADWLEQLTAPFARPGTQAVAGFFRADPDPASVFQIALGATVLPVADEIQPDQFLPSSRSVAFTRSAWHQAGGYPEWLDYCEDLIFDLNMIDQGIKFSWQPSALVLFAPRPSLGAFWQQYYKYARGDGKAGLFLKRHLLRYGIYLVGIPSGLWLAGKQPAAYLALVAAGILYLKQPYRRLRHYSSEYQSLGPHKKLLCLAWVPVIRAWGDIAKMAGYPIGVKWRQKYRTQAGNRLFRSVN